MSTTESGQPQDDDEQAETHDHEADGAPTADEFRAGESEDVQREVAEHAQEMYKLGAEVKGEGEIR